MMMRLLTPLFALMLVGGMTVGCENEPDDAEIPGPGALQPADQPVREIEVIATDFAFAPTEIVVEAGRRLAVDLVNRGEVPHNIEFELPEGEQMLLEPIGPGESEMLTLTAPSEPGEYTFYCPVGDHEQRGMEGVLIVEPATEDEQADEDVELDEQM